MKKVKPVIDLIHNNISKEQALTILISSLGKDLNIIASDERAEDIKDAVNIIST